MFLRNDGLTSDRALHCHFCENLKPRIGKYSVLLCEAQLNFPSASEDMVCKRLVRDISGILVEYFKMWDVSNQIGTTTF
jgi:hypothetical protein